MTKSEIHRMLQNPIYTGDFRWLGKIHRGSHTPLISHETFARVQDVLRHKPRGRYQKHRHPFMGLLTCGRPDCGCTMTAELKKGKYVYYRCTGARGRCGNAYIRQEDLSALLGPIVDAIQLPAEVADSLGTSQSLAETARRQTKERLEKQRRTIVSKLDRGYDNYLEGKISTDFWTRKSEQWEDERRSLEVEIARLERPTGQLAVTGQQILELAKQAGFLYRTQDPVEQRRLLETVLSNCSFDRGTLCPTCSKPFDLFVGGNKSGIGGESGIRTLADPLDSVSCRFHNARVAVNPNDAVAPCPPLPARQRTRGVAPRPCPE